MRNWINIITEGSDFHCPNCDEYLGKTSEVILNNNKYCGNCGWDARKPSSPEPVSLPEPAPRFKRGDLVQVYIPDANLSAADHRVVDREADGASVIHGTYVSSQGSTVDIDAYGYLIRVSPGSIDPA